jgi:DNA-binding transcriptional LysR family regulator
MILATMRCCIMGSPAPTSAGRCEVPADNGRLPVRPVLYSGNGDVLKTACLAGRGITLLPAYTVARHLATGELVPVLEGFEPPPVALHAVYPADQHRPAKTIAFVDFLDSRFRKRPPGGPV